LKELAGRHCNQQDLDKGPVTAGAAGTAAREVVTCMRWAPLKVSYHTAKRIVGSGGSCCTWTAAWHMGLRRERYQYSSFPLPADQRLNQTAGWDTSSKPVAACSGEARMLADGMYWTSALQAYDRSIEQR
jgi:hypothetical protein